jgi:hypothetical protein
VTELKIPERYNYIAVFLTLACNLRCPFCINRFSDEVKRYPVLPGDRWIEGLNRLVSRPDLPVTLQGGEPSQHPDFHTIVNGLRDDLNIDILTNLQFDVDRLLASVPPGRVRRDAPYASIRVSYHPGQMDMPALVLRVQKLLEHGYSVGVWAVGLPGYVQDVELARQACLRAGIDFRVKEFLGVHDDRLHGTYKYPGALAGEALRTVRCRTSELIVGPTGDVFRCHADLYRGRPPVGSILDPEFQIEDIYRPCDCFGLCNPCDVKLKTNRFQKFGHTSVDIVG